MLKAQCLHSIVCLLVCAAREHVQASDIADRLGRIRVGMDMQIVPHCKILSTTLLAGRVRVGKAMNRTLTRMLDAAQTVVG